MLFMLLLLAEQNNTASKWRDKLLFIQLVRAGLNACREVLGACCDTVWRVILFTWTSWLQALAFLENRLILKASWCLPISWLIQHFRASTPAWGVRLSLTSPSWWYQSNVDAVVIVSGSLRLWRVQILRVTPMCWLTSHYYLLPQLLVTFINWVDNNGRLRVKNRLRNLFVVGAQQCERLPIFAVNHRSLLDLIFLAATNLLATILLISLYLYFLAFMGITNVVPNFFLRRFALVKKELRALLEFKLLLKLLQLLPQTLVHVLNFFF